MATLYYTSLDHVTRSTPDGAGTKVTYGDGAADYAADRTALVNARQALSDAIMDDITGVNISDPSFAQGASRRGVALQAQSAWTLAAGVYTAVLKAIMPMNLNDGQSGFAAARQTVAAASGAGPASPFTPQYEPPSAVSPQFSKTLYDDSVAAIKTIMDRIASPNWGTDGQLGLSSFVMSDDLWHGWWHANIQYLSGIVFTSPTNPLTIAWTKNSEDARYQIDVMAYCVTHALWWTSDNMRNLAASATGFSDSTNHGAAGHDNTKVRVIICNASNKRAIWSKEFTSA